MNECAFPFMEIEHPVRGKLKIPYRQYEMNDKKQFVVIAIDFYEGIELGEHEGIEYVQMGKLQEQNFIFQSQVINSLRLEKWDFDNYPDPEIVLITKKNLIGKTT